VKAAGERMTEDLDVEERFALCMERVEGNMKYTVILHFSCPDA
jgi:hypothetical protein